MIYHPFPDTLLLTVHFGSTWFMTGLIWFVQLVHYPLFNEVGEKNFRAYEKKHQTRTGWIVAPVMGIELVTGVLLVLSVPNPIRVMNIVALALIWASTAFIQMPLHAKLDNGFTAAAVRKLVFTNWIRTVLWSGRALLLSCQ